MSRVSSHAWFAALAALLALRAALAFAPGTWLWSLDLQRDLPIATGWGLWLLATLALVPAMGRAMGRALEGPAGALEAAPGGAFALAAAAAGALVFALPDRTWFTGDFLLRVGVLESRVDLARIAPQSLPLDLALHVTWPRRLAAAGWLAHPADAARWIGALEAAALAALALAAAGWEGRRGAARIAFAAVAAGGAGLALMTGYGKTSGEMVPLALAVAVLCGRLAREGRGGAALGLTLGLALLSHRSALLLLPGWGAAWWAASRSGRLPRGGFARLAGIGAPLLALGVSGPRLAGLLGGFDLPRHLAGGDPAALLAGALGPLALLDRVNVALAYAPLAPLLALPVPAPAGAPAAEREAPPALTLALAVPAAAMALLVTPQQGLFRDWDVFAIPGTLLALATARRASRWAGGAAGEERGRRTAALLACAVLGAGLWLAVGHDERAGLARVRAFATRAPARDAAHVARLWEFLGDRAAARRRWEESAAALREAVLHQPTPRLYLMLSIAEAELGNLEAAERAIARAAERDSSVAGIWEAAVMLSLRRGNEEGARAAARGLARISPGHPLVRRVLGDPAAPAGSSEPARPSPVPR